MGAGATACSASTGTTPSRPTAPTSGLPVGNSPPATTGTAGSAATATGTDNGRTLTLKRGQWLQIVLASTYWHFQTSSNPAVLRLDGRPQVNPQPSGCVPGAGCGTATANYLALTAGSAVVTATRTSCGEAAGCTGTNGLFSLRVLVR
jgi:hypothetical protein